MVLRISRGRRGDDPGVRMLLFAVGAVLALAGIFFDIGWLVTLAIVILGAGMIVGIIARRRLDGLAGNGDDERHGGTPG